MSTGGIVMSAVLGWVLFSFVVVVIAAALLQRSEDKKNGVTYEYDDYWGY